MKTSNWAAVTFLGIILTAVGMVGMGWFGSGRHCRASAASRSPQAAPTQTRGGDLTDSQAARLSTIHKASSVVLNLVKPGVVIICLAIAAERIVKLPLPGSVGHGHRTDHSGAGGRGQAEASPRRGHVRDPSGRLPARKRRR